MTQQEIPREPAQMVVEAPEWMGDWMLKSSLSFAWQARSVGERVLFC